MLLCQVSGYYIIIQYDFTVVSKLVGTRPFGRHEVEQTALNLMKMRLFVLHRSVTFKLHVPT